MDFLRAQFPNFFSGQSDLPTVSPSSSAFTEDAPQSRGPSNIEVVASALPAFAFTKVFSNWGMLFDRSSYSLPNPTGLRQRMQTNLVYFWTNYMVILFVFMLYALFTNLTLVFACSVGFGIYYYLFRAREENEKLVLGGIEIGDKIKTMVMIPVVVLLIYFFGTSSLYWVVGLFLTIVLFHTIFFSDEKHSPSLG